MLKIAFVWQARGTTNVFEWFAKLKEQCNASFSRHPPGIKTDEHFDEENEGTCAQKQRNCSS